MAGGAAGDAAASPARPCHVLLTQVMKAELTKNFSTFGTMDPYAVLELASAEGVAMKRIAQTPTDWGGNLTPVWNYKCFGQPYDPDAPESNAAGDHFKFSVFERPFGDFGSPIFCGSAVVPIATLLAGEGARASAGPAGPGAGARPHELELLGGGAAVGTITVQVLLVQRAATTEVTKLVEDMQHVDESMFVKPVERLQISGGTAPFFQLRLAEEQRRGRSETHYVGKDLSHTQDEVLFYDEALALAGKPHASDLGPLLEFMFEYAGIFTSPERGASPDAKPLELLVLRNLFDGCEKLRMLDIKIGQKTASADWYGKSRTKAYTRAVIDTFTNSGCEGFRLAGFNGPPKSFTSRDPLIDIPAHIKKEAAKKKVENVVFSKMQGAEMFAYFLDVHQEPRDPGADGLAATISPTELVELVLHEIAHQLVLLAVSCRGVNVPQKWVGSSVSLVFDCGRLLPRDGAEAEIRKAVRVHIFDWGRSELNTVEKHMGLTEKEQHDRHIYWRYYTGGIDRLAWEALRAYAHRYGSTEAWGKLTFTICDFESLNPNDNIGTVEVPLEPTAEPRTVPIDPKAPDGATLTYSIELRDYPAGARLKTAWRVTVHSAARLKLSSAAKRAVAAIGSMSKNQITLSDPYVTLTLVSGDGRHTFRQSTAVAAQCTDPKWDETFEVPVASAPGRLGEAVARAAPGLEARAQEARDLPWPAEGCRPADEAASMAAWVDLLNSACPTPACGIKPNQTKTYVFSTISAEKGRAASAIGGLLRRFAPKRR